MTAMEFLLVAEWAEAQAVGIFVQAPVVTAMTPFGMPMVYL
jgi:hypothetical protein